MHQEGASSRPGELAQIECAHYQGTFYMACWTILISKHYGPGQLRIVAIPKKIASANKIDKALVDEQCGISAPSCGRM